MDAPGVLPVSIFFLVPPGLCGAYPLASQSGERFFLCLALIKKAEFPRLTRAWAGQESWTQLPADDSVTKSSKSWIHGPPDPGLYSGSGNTLPGGCDGLGPKAVTYFPVNFLVSKSPENQPIS